MFHASSSPGFLLLHLSFLVFTSVVAAGLSPCGVGVKVGV